MNNNKVKLQIEVMLTLQNELNAAVNPEWKTAGNDWLRAIWIECAELLDHVGYKWWKKQQINIKQAQIEVVDIFHFLLSYLLEEYNTEFLIRHTESSLLFCEGFIQTLKEENEETLREHIEAFAGNILYEKDPEREGGATHAKSFLTELFFIMLSLDLSFDELYTIYVSKNALNIFRQDNGYKTGTYIKQWPSPIEYNSTVEDNVILEAFLDNPSTKEVLKTRPEIFFEYLYEYLENSYPGNK